MSDNRSSFFSLLEQRLAEGAKTYGFAEQPGGDPRSIHQLIGELQKELLDVAGWGKFAYDKLESMRVGILDALNALCRLLAERQNAAPSLAADLQLARARVEVLEAEARDLAAAKASAEDKLEQIRVAMRGAHGIVGISNALDQIQRLLPPENVGSVGPKTGDADAGEKL